MGAATSADLNISLEPHLVETLKPLQTILPSEIGNQLVNHLSEPSVIPYSLLHAISQWSRTSDGKRKLDSRQPPLNPQDYTMVALLAGTTTSPERKFGEWAPEKEPEEVEAQRIRDRKAITALINALLSIVGAGIATWWAGDKIGWRNEWRALLALFVAIVVAVAEGGLYLIWQSKRSDRSAPTLPVIEDKKGEDSQLNITDEAFSSASRTVTGELRQRR